MPPAGVPIQVPPVGDGEANANVVQNIDPPVPVIDAGQEGASVMAVDSRKFQELISTSIAKGVEIGVAKALAILEPGRSAPTHVASDGPIPSTSSATSTLPSGSLPVPSMVQASTSNLQQPTPSSANVEMSNIIAASSLPPQLPGRPAADATAQSNPLDFMVPQKIKDKIWAREFVELSTLLLDEDQGMELQISSHSSKPTFTLVPKTKREVNTIARWTKAFNCFTAVYSRKWPEEIPGLLKHMEVVVGLADDNTNWKAYDKGSEGSMPMAWSSLARSILICTFLRPDLPFTRVVDSQVTLTARGKEERGRSPNNTLVDSASNSTTGRSVMAATTSTHATIVKDTTRSLSVKKGKKNWTQGPTPGRVRNTPVKPDVLSHYLQGYDQEKASYLVDGFSYGFHVESEGLVGSRTEVHNPRMAEHLQQPTP